MRLWDPDAAEPVGYALTGHTSRATSVAFSPAGHLFASAGDDGALRLWDPGTRQQIGDALTEDPSRTSSTARYRCSTTASSTNITGPPSRSSDTTEKGPRPPALSSRYRNTVAQEPNIRPESVKHLPEPARQA